MKWLKSEDGFQIFEKTALTQGAVLVALGVLAAVIWGMSKFWNEVFTEITNL